MSRPVRVGDASVAILAGGLATRLRPVTEKVPKALVDVAGQPFVDHQLQLLARRGVRHVVLCLGHLGEQVRAHVGNGGQHGLHVDYSFDGATLLGTAGALKAAQSLLSEVFLVMYGDSYLDVALQPILDAFDAARQPCLMTILRNEGRWDRSNVLFVDGVLKRYDKRDPTAAMAHIDYGLAVLHQETLERVPDGEPFDLAQLYGELVRDKKVSAVEVDRRFYEIGSPEGLEETRALLGGRISGQFEATCGGGGGGRL
jgi:NDP-sugar pyrophosphorylase family protein